MSEKPFEVFIVDHFTRLSEKYIQAGYRYQFKSSDASNSEKLYRTFIQRSGSSEVVRVKEVALRYVECAGVKLIPVIHQDSGQLGYTENFISFLRDEVAAQRGEFEGTALLIIHNSLLDTLINSAEDITAAGGIFDPAKIKASLANLIDGNDAPSGREISKILLNYQYDLITEDRGTMFGFESLYEAIKDGDIRFREIDLLEDPAIRVMQAQPEQIRNRLDQNRALFDEIESVVQHYPDQLIDHLPELGEGFIAKNFDPEDTNAWKQVSFDEYKKEQDRNRQQNLILVDESSATSELVVRTKNQSKAAQKERQILLVVEGGRSDFDLSLDFTGGKLTKDEVKLLDKASMVGPENIALSGGNTNSNMTVFGAIADQPVFFMLSLKRAKTSENYKFKCLVVKKSWFNVEALRNCFVINPKKQLVTLQTQETTLLVGLSEYGPEPTQIKSVGNVFDVNKHQLLDFESLANEVERIGFTIKNGMATLNFDIEGAAATEGLILPLLFDLQRRTRLFTDQFFGVFNRSMQRVYVENKEFKASKSSLDLLNKEASWVDALSVSQQGEQSYSITDLAVVSPELATAYQGLYSYYVTRNTLPSLCGWGPAYQALVKNVVVAYHQYLTQIEQKSYLSDQQKRVINIGFRIDGDGEWITPFHPLVLAYYLQLAEQAQSDQSFLELPPVTLERLNPQGLLPYIYDDQHDFSYVHALPDNSFWLHCVPHKETNYSYVTKLVKEKVREFSEAFKSLFKVSEVGARPTLIISSVNNYNNHELFMGLVGHLIVQRNKSFNIHVNLYDDDLMCTEFDRFADMGSYEEIKQVYGLNKGKSKDHADTVVDLLRTRVTYSKFTHDDVDQQAYSHLSFFRNNQKVAVVDVDPEERLSGISAQGLINGEASSSEQGNYITGFGLANLEQSENMPLQLALLCGRLLKPARKAAFEYRDNSAIALAVDDRFKAQLERSYESSIWTSIIDPKVTLDFFANTQDMLLIHYSDQYTSSAGYDAITVTRQTELYDRVLEKDDGGLVGEFNAFNGEWLLKMITDNYKLRKEHKGILAAYKLVSCLLSQSDITWVPMSAAEMVRVSGNIGLNISESEFSRHLQGYKSGPISDDVLFVGFKGEALYLLPLEVKTGASYDAGKAVKQAKELARYLVELLSTQDFAAGLYRSLFIRQVLMQVDKYELYKVYPESYFTPLLACKEWWLQGTYQLATIANYPKGFVVANLESDKCFSTSTEEVDQILKIEVPSSFMKATISTRLQVLWQDYSVTAAASIPSRYFLKHSSRALIDTPVTASVSESIDVSKVAGVEAIGEFDTEPEINTVLAPIAETSIVVVPRVQIQEDEAGIVGPEDVMPIAMPEEPVVQESLKVLVGHEVNHQHEVYWEPTNTAKFMNTNSGIIGTMGTGKTQCTKSVVTQLYRNQHLNIDGKPIGILIFDYKSDYVDDRFLDATAAKKYNLHKLPYNPLSLFGDTPMLPVHTARGFSETMSRAFGLGQKQQLRLRKLIGEAYELAGISKSDKSTWSKPAPTISDIWALFVEPEKVEEDSLYAALESLYELEIFEDDITKCTSLYELIDGIRVIELAGYPPQIQSLVVALTLDLFYSQMQKQGKPEVRGDFRQVTKMILVDEADNFMSQDFPSLRKVLKEGREYGVGVILSTQDITHFKTKENDYSAYILSWVIHRVSQIKNQDIKSLFNKDDKKEQEHLMGTIRGLEKHHSLYVDGGKKISKIKDKAFWELG